MAAGCAMDVGSDETNSATIEAPLSPSISAQFNWAQGNTATFMGDSNQWSCFLTRMKGNFQGWGEMISAEVSGSPGGGHWYLGGSSFQQGVEASGRCWAHNSDQDIAYFNWAQDNDRTDMGAGWAMCALVKISGKFQSTSEYVRIVKESVNHWYLDGSSTTYDVNAWAACSHGVISGPEYKWTSGRKDLETSGTGGRKFCYLTKVGGNFDNANDGIAITLDSTEMWNITGSGSGGKEVRARCASF